MRKRYLPKAMFRAVLKVLVSEKRAALSSILVVGLLCLSAGIDNVRAAEASIKLIQNGVLKGKLIMQFQAEEVFSEKVIKFLNRGFTVGIEYKVELWRKRRYWFDHLDIQHKINYQIDFEPLKKRYVCLKSQQGTAIASKLGRKLAEIVLWTTRPDPPLSIIPAERLDPKASYYYNVEILIATLTTEDIKDLQKWLSKFGEEDKETSTFTKTSFKVAADFISSRNHKKLSARSEEFRLGKLPKFDS